MTSSNAELGTDEEFVALVAKINKFDYATATDRETAALTRALKLVAEDTTRRWMMAREYEQQIRDKLATASAAAELAEVVAAIRPTTPVRRRWFR